MSTLGERMGKAVAHYLSVKKLDKIDREEFAKFCGVTTAAVGQWINGKTGSLDSFKNARAAQYLGVNSNWLAGDPKFQMLDVDDKASNSEPQLFTQIDENFRLARIKFAKPSGNRPIVRIPVYRDVKAACGAGFDNFLEDPSDYIEMDPLVLKMLGIDSKPENLKIIYSVEDSMFPTVPHDKPLFIDVSDRDPSAIKTGGIYVFTHAYSCRMKRIFMGFDKDGSTKSIRLASDNPDKNMFPDEWITHEQLNEINFVGRLVWTGKEL